MSCDILEKLIFIVPMSPLVAHKHRSAYAANVTCEFNVATELNVE